MISYTCISWVFSPHASHSSRTQYLYIHLQLYISRHESEGVKGNWLINNSAKKISNIKGPYKF